MAPFSNKKKKIQLQQKRQMKRERGDDPNAFYRTIMQRPIKGKLVTGSQQNQNVDGKQSIENGGGRGRDRFADLQFFKDTDEEIKIRKEQSMNPIQPLKEVELEIDPSEPLPSLNMPKRPRWDKTYSKEQLDRQEQIYFKHFVDDMLDKATLEDKKLSYFDLNLDTWRQLWRVLEMSEVITIIVDIRHPLFHFPPTLYNYIVNDLNKIVIVILNKIDLVPASLVIAWRTYLKKLYPEAHILPFASYAGMKVKSNGKRVGNMKMAADGAKRFMLEVERLVGNEIIDFTSWKEKIQTDCEAQGEDADLSDSDAEDSDGDGKAIGQKALKNAEQIKTKNDTGYYSAERFKDGILTIGCVGHPNVGKSSFMNALYGKKVVSVSRTPGHTKHFQTIFLTPNIRLCDCPGLVFPSYYPKQLQVLMGCYPISQLREPYSSIQYLAERVNMIEKLKLKPIDEIRHQKPALNDRNYTPASSKQIPDSNMANHNNVSNTESTATKTVQVSNNHSSPSSDWSAYTICESWAVLRGFLTARAGRPDVYRAANHLLRMALDGRTLCLCSYPPDYVSDRSNIWEQHEDIEKICKIQGKHNIIDEDDDGY